MVFKNSFEILRTASKQIGAVSFFYETVLKSDLLFLYDIFNVKSEIFITGIKA